MKPFNYMTPKEKKEFFAPYIKELIQRRVMPRKFTHNSGGSLDIYYIIEGLPQGRALLFDGRHLSVISGFNEYGFPMNIDNVYYSPRSVQHFLLRGRIGSFKLKERDLVIGFRELINFYKNQGAYGLYANNF